MFHFYFRLHLLMALSITQLFCEAVETFYGTIEVEEQVLLDLIACPAMQRLQWIHQYGVAYYTKTHPEDYTRFDHSLGVFAILRSKGASLEEQIAGLLHDVSHTAFSHVGDWVYGKENQTDDYQSSIFDSYLISSGIEEILNRHGYLIEQISPATKAFLMLEQPLPDLCADRIDYNMQGSYFQKFMTKEEILELFRDLSFENGKWIFTNQELAARLASFSLFMTADCWGSAKNFITSKWLAEAILRGFEIGVISSDEFHFETDQLIWDRLLASKDSFIQDLMQKLLFPDQYYHLVEAERADLLISFKNRGIDPWIKRNEQTVRLTSLNPVLREALQTMKQRADRGWSVKFTTH